MTQANPIIVPAPAIHMPDVIDPCNLPERKRLGRPAGMRDAVKELLPLCPRCQSSEDVSRAGFARGNQRYRCRSKECRNRTFGGPGIVLARAAVKTLMCYRCGSTKTKHLGPSPHSGYTGFCFSCRRRFIQGGRSEVAKYHLLLARRVKESGLPPDVQAEALQAAYRAVLEGQGYCWTVEIDTKAAWRAARGGDCAKGDWGLGSDHPVFRQHAGRSKYDD